MIIADVTTHIQTNDLNFFRTSSTTWSFQPPPLDDLGLARFHQFLMAWNDHTEQMRSTILKPDSFHVLVLDVSLLLLLSLWKGLEQTTSGTCSMEERVGFVGKTWCYVRFLHAPPRFLPKQQGNWLRHTAHTERDCFPTCGYLELQTGPMSELLSSDQKIHRFQHSLVEYQYPSSNRKKKHHLPTLQLQLLMLTGFLWTVCPSSKVNNHELGHTKKVGSNLVPKVATLPKYRTCSPVFG